MKANGLMLLKLKEDGIYLDDKKLRGVKGLKIDSDVENITEVNIKMAVVVDNLDNLSQKSEDKE